MNSHLLKKTLVLIMTTLFLVSTGAMAKCPKGEHKDAAGNCVKTVTKPK